ncbi:MAG: glutamate--tRNA ligase [Candidatus Aminicenantia bacterium]
MIRVRFAPSPTGYIHVGNARTAVFNWFFARKNKGVFVLRVEDTDVERSTKESEELLIKDLRWLGIDWDEGPNVGGNFGPYRQSERLELYRKYANELINKGYAYFCFCSAEELEREREKAISLGGIPKYSGKCRKLNIEDSNKRVEKGEPAAIRFKVPFDLEIEFNDLVRGNLKFSTNFIEDLVLMKSNGFPSYNFACVIDDKHMEITHVIRGEDHISNTPKQILIYKALGWEPPFFAHLPMVLGSDGTRLSKRHGATSLDQFRENGYLPSALMNYLSLLGWSSPDGREVMEIEEIKGIFDLKRVGKSPSIFDYEKLKWINRHHIRKASVEKLLEDSIPFLRDAGYLPETLTDAHKKWLIEALKAVITNLETLKDLSKEFHIFFLFQPENMDEESKELLYKESSKNVISSLYSKIKDFDSIVWDDFSSQVKRLGDETGIKGKELFHPIRVALTSKYSGLELKSFVPLIEEGSKLEFPKRILNIKERLRKTLNFLERIS